MAETPFISRQERFAVVGSTNDVVRDWLAAGTPEVCVAVADEQSAGRGRENRSWVAPSGAALLLSLGFRPLWLPADRVWRLAAAVGLAMADAAEEVAGLADGTIRLKWPNDLVVDIGSAPELDVRKLAGVLGESVGLGTDDPRVVVGLGINAGWRREDFPAELEATMTSLHDASGGRAVDLDRLLATFIARLESGITALRDGRFDVAAWHARQATTGRRVELRMPDGTSERLLALGVDEATGALLVDDAGIERPVLVGEIQHLRLGAPAPSGV